MIVRKLDMIGLEIECFFDLFYIIKIRVYFSWIIMICVNYDVFNDYRINYNYFMQNLMILLVFYEIDGYFYLEFGNCNWNMEFVVSYLVWINLRQLIFCIYWENIKELFSSMFFI